MSEVKNLFFATILSIVVLTAWQFFYETKKIKEIEPRNAISQTTNTSEENKVVTKKNSEEEVEQDIKIDEKKISEVDTETKQVNQKDLLIKIDNGLIDGTFSRQGLIFTQLSLKKYKENLEENSQEVNLLNKKNFQYAEIGFTSNENTDTELPKKTTIWEADGNTIEVNKPLTLSWVNNEKVRFLVIITLDENYLFKIERKIVNNTNKELDIVSTSKIFKSMSGREKSGVGHEGIIGFFDKELLKITFDKILKQENFTLKSHTNNDKLSWVGFGDKYWMSTIISNEKNTTVNTHTLEKNGEKIIEIEDKYPQTINPQEDFQRTEYMFFGAKELALLDKYSSEKNILMFDHAVDFGMLYFITKPIFLFLQLLHKVIGNFGIAIMILTLVIKFLLFPLTKKSLMSMNRMRKLQPKMDEIKTRQKDNKTAMNLEIVSLFRENKISPFSSIIPMLIQIPIFFALYKVLYITIEMRHAPFFGWIRDLSSKDTFNIFSILDPLHLNISQYLNLGVLSLVLGATMLIQQKTQPKASDPNQANIMKWMPWIFTIASASFPAGLVIYWSWNNIISVVQQLIVEKSVIKSENQVKIEKTK